MCLYKQESVCTAKVDKKSRKSTKNRHPSPQHGAMPRHVAIALRVVQKVCLTVSRGGIMQAKLAKNPIKSVKIEKKARQFA